MPCQHASSGAADVGIDRREFMKTALVIGGSSALAAAQARAHGEGHDPPNPGTDDPSSLPERQFAWDDYVPKNETTLKPKTPEHHLMLMLAYQKEGTPTEEDRQQVEMALQTLERAFEWSNEGLLFNIGYSPAYFDRFDGDLPEGTGLRTPGEVVRETDALESGPVLTEQSDAHLHLSSDSVVPLLAAEQCLFGQKSLVDDSNTVNGVTVTADFQGVFEVVDRRTGFINNPHEQWDDKIGGNNPIPENGDVWFGFKSLFNDSQPTEDVVAIEAGHPFADGTTQQASVLLDHRIRQWHARFDTDEQVARMYSPEHTAEDTGPHGRDLGKTSGTANLRDDGMEMVDIADETDTHAEQEGVVGHAQKLARARKEDGTPPLLRRDFPSTDGGKTHTQFISVQRSIDDFIDVRKAMAFVDIDGDSGPDAPIPDHDESSHPDDHVDWELPRRSFSSELPGVDHGIQGHFRVKRRGTYLIPPRSLRALPPANP